MTDTANAESTPEKLKMHTPDLVSANLAWVAERFPGCITESRNDKGELVRAVNFDQLRQELSTEIVEGQQERYHLNWPGKREALLAANAPIAKTLRPCREESVDFDTTRNLFIEGDNLDALKLLQETYLNKVKMIYIDPPYNTGSDLVYDDDYADTKADFLQRSQQVDDLGHRLVANTEANGRFHSDWLTMMYPRLKLARTLLRDDGVIFISIGDQEIATLRQVCGEVFGEGNFLGCVARIAKKTSNKGTYFAPSKDYVLAYARNGAAVAPFMDAVDEAYKKKFKDTDERGHYATVGLYQAALDPMRGCSNQRYWIECPDGTFAIPPGDNFPATVADASNRPPQSRNDKVWRWSYQSYLNKKELLVFKQTSRSPLVTPSGDQSPWNVYTKYYLEDRLSDGIRPRDYLDDLTNDLGTAALKRHGLDDYFDFAKPPELIARLAKWLSDDDGIVLDFFAGSGSTAEAVFGLNATSGSRRWILVQLPESTDTNAAAVSAGFSNLAQVAIERVKRSAAAVQSQSQLHQRRLDLGFRVLKIDSSNMKDVYYRPDEASAELLGGLVDNIKDDRDDEDLLFQVLLDWGVDLSLPITTETIGGKTVYFVDTNALAACFETGITEDFVKELAGRKPLRVVFHDSGYSGDDVKINVEQIFKQLSPGTDVKTL